MNLSTKQKIFLLTVGTLLTLAIPLVALLINYDWQPSETLSSLRWLYWITESGSLPYAIATCGIFTGIALLYLKLDIKKSALFVFSLFLCIGAGQAIKSGIKEMRKESRPYVLWMEKQDYINKANAFYDQNRQERKEFIASQDFSAHSIPTWLQKHWSKETGFSFPSGHSLFAAQWLLIFLLLLWSRKKAFFVLFPFIAFWSLSMEASRLVLGMHWPIDEIVSCLFAPIIVYLTSLSWDKWIIPQHNNNNFDCITERPES